MEGEHTRVVPQELCPLRGEWGEMVRIKAVTVLHSSGKFHNSYGFGHPQDYWPVTFFLKTVRRVCEGKNAAAGCLESEGD